MIYLSHMPESERKDLVGESVRFFARWSSEERFGIVTRISHNIIWVGAYCYAHTDLQRLREWRV